MSEIIYEKHGKKLVWNDEFELPFLDNAKWDNVRLMNNPGLIYDNGDKNLRIQDSMLHLQVNRAGKKFTLCESVTTKYKMLFKYGYVEMRAKLPFRHGAWPSFWMKGDTPLLRNEENRNNWFPETDIFEVFSSFDKISPNIHRWGSKNGEGFHEMLPGVENSQKRSYKFENSEKLNDEFHTYGLLWNKDSMKFFVDDFMYFETPIDERSSLNNATCGDMMGFHDPQYLIINNEVFTTDLAWYPEGAALNTDDEMPIDYYVDYVRLYQDSESDTLIIGEELEKVYGKK